MMTLFSLLLACTPVRFHKGPIVWKAMDDADIELPKERVFRASQYMSDVFVMERSIRALALRDHDPAQNTNALDEVPNSTWFTNRIGAKILTPEEIEIGPAHLGPPHLPLLVTKGKSGGGNPGFFAQDDTGRTFLIKWDPLANPEQQTAASVVVGRLLWASGYNVPADTVFVMSEDDFKIKEGATFKDGTPITREKILDGLSSAPRRPDGTLRVSASQFLEGRPVGGFALSGVRRDDPNDRIPHQQHRELRGLRAIAAWLDHTDMKEDNTLDMWIEDDGRHYLKHNLVDFGEALGAHATEKNRMEDGYESFIDWGKNGRSLLSLGLWTRPWEKRPPSPFLSVGPIDPNFDPNQWREAYPYWAFREADRSDLFWGAKIVMRFDRAQIEAAVRAAQFSDPAAGRWLVDALESRRDRVGEAWLDTLTALDGFSLKQGEICATDLSLAYGLANNSVVERLNRRDEVLLSRVPDADGRVCFPALPGAYTVDRLRIRRDSSPRPPLHIHYDEHQIRGLERTPRSTRLVTRERAS